MSRTPERIEFLANVVTTAIESGIGYWADVVAYRWGFPDLGRSDGTPHVNGSPAFAEAVIRERGDDDDKLYTVDIEVVARGLRLLRENADGYGAYLRNDVLLADRTNGEDGDLDAFAADVIVQLGLFGVVVYG